tara:strand:+ start:1031 stop:1975 length:945 start_codon:yes stop_codon:yes gene_type:complete
MLENKICYVFNKIFLSLIKEVKSKNDEVKHTLKQHYKIFDKQSSEYIVFFVNNINDNINRVLFSGDDILDNVEVLNMLIFENITINDLVIKVIKDNEHDRNTLKYYVYLLMLLSYIYKLEIDTEKKKILLETVLNIISVFDTEDVEKSDVEGLMEDIIDDDIKTVLWKIYDNKEYLKNVVSNEDIEGVEGLPNLDFMKNTKIGNLAKEISETIDVSKLNIDNPEELLNVENIFNGGGSNNVIGDIIKTVGDQISSKIQNGELNQEDLMTEALGMMGNLNMGGENDMMSQMMNMMNANQNPTRRRLQKKLQNRKN